MNPDYFNLIMKNILVTGGTGFIGSHTVVSLLKSGHQVVILDNLCNSSINILPRLKTITGQEIPFYQGDIRDREILRRIFAENRIDSVIHFAGLKAVGESVAEPMKYYDNMFPAAWCWRKKWRVRACLALCSVLRRRFMAIRAKCLIPRICHWAIPPALTAHRNQWLSAFSLTFKKPIRAGA
ncbi:UDP-glucose 4-epimerase (galactowaldenase%3B UDP-galactose 4-epimerase) [Neisseria meningitidis]|nr:UDP-glucose 4-epimerase (galactowaldenase%3B UDP-galactose 4-epimerase) [Neisseria meningitidis]CKL06480.1 UDP-glucose 4-epimerase (galactowaldenase%3B UDP-galactose 4-epimerase) [Neisseria meningitidis]